IGAPASGPGSVARSRHSASSHPTACRSSQGHEGSGGEPALRPTRPDLFPQSVEPNIPPIEERLPAADSPPGKSSLGPPAAPHGAGDRSAILPNGESRLAIPERLSRHQQPEVVSWLHETTILHNAQLLMTLRLNSGGIIQPVDRQSRKELGIEIRGLLRQYLAVESTISHRLNGRRVHQKAELRLSPPDLLHGGVEIAHVMRVSLFPNSLRIDSQRALQ